MDYANQTQDETDKIPTSGRAFPNISTDPTPKNTEGAKQYKLPKIYEMPRSNIVVEQKTKPFKEVLSDNEEEETKQNFAEYDPEEDYSQDFSDVQPSVRPT